MIQSNCFISGPNCMWIDFWSFGFMHSQYFYVSIMPCNQFRIYILLLLQVDSMKFKMLSQIYKTFCKQCVFAFFFCTFPYYLYTDNYPFVSANGEVNSVVHPSMCYTGVARVIGLNPYWFILLSTDVLRLLNLPSIER